MAPLSEAHDARIAELIPELDRLAADVMADWKEPGAALAVVRDNEVAFARAYGQRDVEASLPVTTETRFLICSITKSFTATGVALLHDEGRLDWTRPRSPHRLHAQTTVPARTSSAHARRSFARSHRTPPVASDPASMLAATGATPRAG